MKAEWYLGFMIAAILALAAIPLVNGTKAIPGLTTDPESAALLASTQALVARGGCWECHTIPGIPKAEGKVGPPWCEPAREFQEGKIDLAFLRESIMDPNAEVGAGYPRDKMPQNFKQVFTDQEINTLATFISKLDCKE